MLYAKDTAPVLYHSLKYVPIHVFSWSTDPRKQLHTAFVSANVHVPPVPHGLGSHGFSKGSKDEKTSFENTMQMYPIC